MDGNQAQLLEYLKSVIENSARPIPFDTWMSSNEMELENFLTRWEITRLCMREVKEVPRILDRFNIQYAPQPGWEENWKQDRTPYTGPDRPLD